MGYPYPNSCLCAFFGPQIIAREASVSSGRHLQCFGRSWLGLSVSFCPDPDGPSSYRDFNNKDRVPLQGFFRL